MAHKKELYIYVFGRPKDTLEYMDVPDRVIVAKNSKEATSVLKSDPDYDADSILKKKSA